MSATRDAVRPETENNEVLARLSLATSWGVGAAVSARISLISLSERILNVLLSAVAITLPFAGSEYACMLRENRVAQESVAA